MVRNAARQGPTVRSCCHLRSPGTRGGGGRQRRPAQPRRSRVRVRVWIVGYPSAERGRAGRRHTAGPSPVVAFPACAGVRRAGAGRRAGRAVLLADARHPVAGQGAWTAPASPPRAEATPRGGGGWRTNLGRAAEPPTLCPAHERPVHQNDASRGARRRRRGRGGRRVPAVPPHEPGGGRCDGGRRGGDADGRLGDAVGDGGLRGCGTCADGRAKQGGGGCALDQGGAPRAPAQSPASSAPTRPATRQAPATHDLSWIARHRSGRRRGRRRRSCTAIGSTRPPSTCSSAWLGTPRRATGPSSRSCTTTSRPAMTSWCAAASGRALQCGRGREGHRACAARAVATGPAPGRRRDQLRRNRH